MRVLNGLTFAVDTPEAILVGSHDCLIIGWAFATNLVDEPIISVYSEGVEVQAFQGLARNDVASYYREPSIQNCGFVIRFRCPSTSSTPKLFCRLNGVEFLLSEHIAVSDGDSILPWTNVQDFEYETWIRKQEPSLFWKESEISNRLASLDYKPTISIILPVYNTPLYFLHRCIKSVLDQHYSDWQLCVADDSSSDAAVMAMIEAYASCDSRITIRQCARQGGISAASNVALESASGEFVVLLDHDDELHPYSLLEVVRALNTNSNVDLVYSDEDKIDEWGIRSQPAFKPDFDIDIFLSFNYLGHLVAIRRTVVSEVGGFRSSCDGAQDWDLLIRVVEVIDRSRICHIRKPLYHWRMHINSTAQSLEAKPYVSKAWRQVLEQHATRTDKDVRILNGLFFGSMRMLYPSPKNAKIAVFLRSEDGIFQTSIVRMNAGKRVLQLYRIEACSVFAIEAQENAAFAASAKGDVSMRHSLYTISDVEGDLFVFINGPLECINHLFWEELLAQGLRKDCGLVTGLSLNADGKTIATGLLRTGNSELRDPYAQTDYPSHGYMGQLSVVRSVDGCSESFLAVRREHLAAVGGLGVVSSSKMNRLVRLLGENALKKGLDILFTPYAVATFSDFAIFPRDSGEERMPGSLRINPQFLAFEESRKNADGLSR